MPRRIHLIRTYHPHWGKYSGINRFIDYINPEQFKMDVQLVPMGDDHFPSVHPKIRYRIKHWVKKNGVQAYDLNDLVAEITAFRQWFKGQIDILHYLEGEHSLQYLPSLMKKLRFLKQKPPIVASFHQPPKKLDSLINIKIVRHLDRVIVLSPEQVSYFEQYLEKDKILLIKHGIDTDYFQPSNTVKSDQKFKFLTVGSWLRDYKTVLAVAKSLECYPDLEFHIVSSKVNPSDEYKNVYIHQNISDQELLKLYQQSHVLFLPLLNATANNAILEGIACGLPIVSTDLLSIRTYVPGKEAILIQNNQPEKFSETLLYLYENPEVCAEISAAARKRATELSWQEIAQDIEKLYSKVLT